MSARTLDVVTAGLVLACSPLLMAGDSMILTVGADWDADQIVPWEQELEQATLVIYAHPDGSAINARHLLLGSFNGTTWAGRKILSFKHDPKIARVDRYEITFEPVSGCSVMLVVAAGPTTGLKQPRAFVFGQLTGDVNGDRLVTPIDWLSVMNHINAGSPYDPALDVDRNGSINPTDALIIENLIRQHPEGVPFIASDPVRPPPTMPPSLTLWVARPQSHAILSLHALAFAREYVIKKSASLTTWEEHATHVENRAKGDKPLLLTVNIGPSGGTFFRLAAP